MAARAGSIAPRGRVGRVGLVGLTHLTYLPSLPYWNVYLKLSIMM